MSDGKLIALKPDDVSPRVFLEQCLQNVDSFKSVFVVFQYQDDTMDCDWSKMETQQVAMACIVAQLQAQDCIRDRSKG